MEGSHWRDATLAEGTDLRGKSAFDLVANMNKVKVTREHTSTKGVSFGSNAASMYALRISFSWVSELGTVKLGVFPSKLTAVPRMIARIASPSWTASASGLTRMALIASPLAYPLADASNDLHVPSGDKAGHNEAVAVGVNMRLVPATIAILQSPAAIARAAEWRAISDDEQALFVVHEGPRKSNS